mgnify:FL=1
MISLNWVKDYVDIENRDLKKLATEITQAGINVEKVVTKHIDNLVIGEVLTCENHPDSDHLHICLVDIGNETLQIVCGAKNVRQGIKVIVAKDGCVLRGNNVIKKGKIRGVESNGMICALFELGIDDYVVKPFSPRELMMRVKAVLGRRGNPAADQGEDGKEIYRIDGLVIDCTARTVMVDGERVNMTPKEYDLLFYMIRNRGVALSREKLITEVWGYDYYGDDRTLDTHIKLLRSSLGQYRSYLVTLRGVGYRFEA